jgi:hypothetical protein
VTKKSASEQHARSVATSKRASPVSPLTRQARRPSCSSLVGSPESPLPLSPKKPSLDLIDVDLPYKDILPSFASGLVRLST